jgi:hypothetical protein
MYGYLVDFLTTKGTKLFSKELCLPLRTLRKALRFSKVLLDVLDFLTTKDTKVTLRIIKVWCIIGIDYH